MLKIQYLFNICGPLLIIACNNNNQNTQKENVGNDSLIQVSIAEKDTAPISLEFLQSSETAPLSESAMHQIYTKIYPGKAPKQTNNFSNMSLEKFKVAGDNFLTVIDLYKDSSKATHEFLSRTNDIMSAYINKQINEAGTNADLRLKLQIMQIRSDINTKLAELKINDKLK